jgi:hypothetical protein
MLSAAKHLYANRARPFAALSVTVLKQQEHDRAKLSMDFVKTLVETKTTESRRLAAHWLPLEARYGQSTEKLGGLRVSCASVVKLPTLSRISD